MLVSAVIPIMSIYRLPLGQYSYTGHVINLPQDVISLAHSLSRLPSELDVLALIKELNLTFSSNPNKDAEKVKLAAQMKHLRHKETELHKAKRDFLEHLQDRHHPICKDTISMLTPNFTSTSKIKN